MISFNIFQKDKKDNERHRNTRKKDKRQQTDRQIKRQVEATGDKDRKRKTDGPTDRLRDKQRQKLLHFSKQQILS